MMTTSQLRCPFTLTETLRLFAVATMVIATCVTATMAAEARSAGDAELFNRLDANHDGFISAGEVSTENQRLFDRLLRRGDANHDQSLSRGEFLAALVPSRPEKPIETKQPASLPQADAVRYLLLSMDKNENGVIEPNEVPKALKPAFEFMLDRLDVNKNGRLDRYELTRGGPALSLIAGRYVDRKGIDVKAELAKLEKSEGSKANRFDEQPMPLENLRDPKKARQLFAQLDQNGDGQIEKKEVPDPLQKPLERFMRMADRNDDGKLSEREFLDGAERLSRYLSRRDKQVRRELKAKKNAVRDSKVSKSKSDAGNS
ncbi:MAG TPA: EF-hand domain-containing protein [Lacipirellulaceae bacterium]|nr:EF-hand domain-containing protein [Lacipirellulaceae bacterium]